MNKQLIVTNLTYREKEYTACALYQGQQLLEVTCESSENAGILGNIYVGRVKDIVKNLNAAFIEIAPNVPCYYPLSELENPVFVKKINSPNLVQGDELLVQVAKESMKTKPPRVTTNLNFTGKYLVITSENKRIGLSKKIEKQQRARLKSLIEQQQPAYGVVVRTNSVTATEEQILEELQLLTRQADDILKRAPYQTCFSCMQKQQPEYIKALQNVYTKDLDGIVTDNKEQFEAMKEYLSQYQPTDLDKLRFYQDHQLSLEKCYSLQVKIQHALQERVWLKSGGYLIIQPTEALTVIDVNTGKSAAKGDVQKHYLKVNLEAAEEIAAQLRLRNISGIIIVDFIDLESDRDKQHLMEALRQYTKPDSVPVQVVDMTKLNLVELTRKKIRKSLKEQFT